MFRWKTKSRYWPDAYLLTMRPVFRWKYSGVVIPVFFGTGVAMVLANKFPMAYVFFALFGLWTVGNWLTSDWLREKRELLSSRSIRRDSARFVVEARDYWAWQWGMSVLILGIAGGFVFWTSNTKQKYERDDVYQHLTANHFIPPGSEDDPIDTMFSVSNGGNYPISRTHGITCLTNLAVGNAGTSPVRRMASWVGSVPDPVER